MKSEWFINREMCLWIVAQKRHGAEQINVADKANEMSQAKNLNWHEAEQSFNRWPVISINEPGDS